MYVRGIDSPELVTGYCEPLDVGSGTELRSSGGIIHAVNHGAISPAPEVFFFFLLRANEHEVIGPEQTLVNFCTSVYFVTVPPPRAPL